ncbi:hypothetical protein [Breznakiella homolactica]|uniref:Uncharacterized protein n=1 Tax=Breznakiella homolactica TaxID=2798577 RepID=A0A7T7XNI8_9SPIR|nr:hypothetical protein [Breznakiella homolactica]QQO09629.1 hypothetical protein JFL75_01545 [Breznakiella homolactica]
MRAKVLFIVFLSCAGMLPAEKDKNYMALPIPSVNPMEKYAVPDPERKPAAESFFTAAIETIRSAENTIDLKCLITNTSSSSEYILLKNYHDYHGTLDFPISFFITIKNGKGEILAEEYSPYMYWNTAFKILPEDWILVPPGESVTCMVPLDAMILSMKGNGAILAFNPGKYYIKLAIKFIQSGNRVEIESNELEVVFN